jgi:hypothetical protein
VSGLPRELFKRWVHSHEEDTDEVRVFRPKGYPLPPARGRRGFELRENGEFVQYGIGQTDKSEATVGRWEADGARRANVSFPDGRLEPYVLEIVSLDDDKLAIKR